MWCAVTAFEVKYKDRWRWVKLYQGKEMTTRASNLLPGQQYQVRVRALSKGEAFPFSDVVMFITKIGGKCNQYVYTSKLI
jgi:hypothetical protein